MHITQLDNQHNSIKKNKTRWYHWSLLASNAFCNNLGTKEGLEQLGNKRDFDFTKICLFYIEVVQNKIVLWGSRGRKGNIWEPILVHWVCQQSRNHEFLMFGKVDPAPDVSKYLKNHLEPFGQPTADTLCGHPSWYETNFHCGHPLRTPVPSGRRLGKVRSKLW